MLLTSLARLSLAMSANPEILEIGIDWITATATHKTSARKLYLEGTRLLEDEARSGNDRHHWSMQGYQGFKCGSVQVGTRHDGGIVRLSGGYANDHWTTVFKKADNVSRLDVQVTIKPDNGASRFIQQTYKRACRYSSSLTRGPEVKSFRSLRSGNTVYLGSRKSEVFGRCYDKWRESKLDHYAECVRLEVEMKERLALRAAAGLYDSRRPATDMLGIVYYFFQKRAGATWTAVNMPTFIKGRRSATDRERQLEWVRTACAPTIKRLIADGYRDEVLECLGLRLSVVSASGKIKRTA